MENSYIHRITVALEKIAERLQGIEDALYSDREDDEYRIANVLDEMNDKLYRKRD